MSGIPSFGSRSSPLIPDFVRHVELHDTLPSTNDRAIELVASADLDTPALVVARLQTAGRGRDEHTWWSADGALTFSLILDAASSGLDQCDWPKLSLTTAVAVCDAISRLGSVLPAPCSIKWPNDVLVGGQKICGILLESRGGPAPASSRLIIGIGINVNNSWRDAPQQAGATGSALCDITGSQHDVETLLVEVLRAFEARLKQLAASDPQLPQTWQQLSSLTDRDVAVEMASRTVEGRCLSIAEDGALLVQTATSTERLLSGSVRVV